jgi:hypothetical protein
MSRPQLRRGVTTGRSIINCMYGEASHLIMWVYWTIWGISVQLKSLEITQDFYTVSVGAERGGVSAGQLQMSVRM